MARDYSHAGRPLMPGGPTLPNLWANPAAVQAALHAERRRLAALGAGGGAAAFDPLSLSPTILFDPSDLSQQFQSTDTSSPITASGQSLARANDKSGNGYTLTQSNAANRPLYETDGSRHWWSSDAVSDYLIGASLLPAINDFIVVGSWRRGAGNHCVYNLAGGRSQPNVLYAFMPYGGSHYIDANNFGAGRISAVMTQPANSNFVSVHRRIGSAIIARVNGVQIGSATEAGQIVPVAPMSLLADWDGSLPALRCYGLTLIRGTVADIDMTRLETYYGSKAGLTL